MESGHVFVPVVAGSSAMVGGLEQCNFLGNVTHFSGSPLQGSGIFSLFPPLTFVSDNEDDLVLHTPDFDLANHFDQYPCQNETLLGYLRKLIQRSVPWATGYSTF